MNNNSKQLSMVEQALKICLMDVDFIRIDNILIEPEGYQIQPNILVNLRLPDGNVTLVINYKPSGQPRVAREALAQLERVILQFPRAYAVFAAPYITDETAALCRTYNTGFIDLAGNCRISIWPIFIQRVGQPNPFVIKRDLKSLYSPKATRILRVLLTHPGHSWKTHELAAVAQVSFGQVANVKKLLTDREWIQVIPEGFQLTRPFDLLREWANVYTLKTNRIIEYYSMKAVPELEEVLAVTGRRLGIRYAFTGFSGAARIAPVVRYQRVTAYVDEAGIPAIVDALDLKEVTSGANITLMVPYDAGVWYDVAERDGVAVVTASQLYLDLLGMKSRGAEAAEAVWREAIETIWA